MNNAIIWALAASLCYGIGGPLIQVVGKGGASIGGLAIIYGAGLVMVGALYSYFQPLSFGSGQTMSAITMSAILSLAFICVCSAFATPGSLVTLVVPLASAAPIISVLVEITWMNGGARVSPTMAILGAVLMVAGGSIVTMSVSSAAMQ